VTKGEEDPRVKYEKEEGGRKKGGGGGEGPEGGRWKWRQGISYLLETQGGWFVGSRNSTFGLRLFKITHELISPSKFIKVLFTELTCYDTETWEILRRTLGIRSAANHSFIYLIRTWHLQVDPANAEFLQQFD
jgi:hypothetical protein